MRTSEVKPLIKVACYECETCGAECFQTVDSKAFQPLTDCPAEQCRKNAVRGSLLISSRNSFFVNYQEIKAQEPSFQTPVGHVPKTITIYAMAQSVRRCAPGDFVQVTGIYLPAIIEQTKSVRSRLIHVIL